MEGVVWKTIESCRKLHGESTGEFDLVWSVVLADGVRRCQVDASLISLKWSWSQEGSGRCCREVGIDVLLGKRWVGCLVVNFHDMELQTLIENIGKFEDEKDRPWRLLPSERQG